MVFLPKGHCGFVTVTFGSWAVSLCRAFALDFEAGEDYTAAEYAAVIDKVDSYGRAEICNRDRLFRRRRKQRMPQSARSVPTVSGCSIDNSIGKGISLPTSSTFSPSVCFVMLCMTCVHAGLTELMTITPSRLPSLERLATGIISHVDLSSSVSSSLCFA